MRDVNWLFVYILGGQILLLIFKFFLIYQYLLSKLKGSQTAEEYSKDDMTREK